LRIFFIRYAAPVGKVRITGPLALPQHKGNERIGEAWKTFRCALPIVTDIAYYFPNPKRKYVQEETMANSKFKIMPSAIVRGQCPTIGAILGPLKFSLDTTFNLQWFLFICL
jgi:hypothetical protein